MTEKKILNPATGRYVYADGTVGKKILRGETKEAGGKAGKRQRKRRAERQKRQKR